MQWEIITTEEQAMEWFAGVSEVLALDIETGLNKHLLGISFSDGKKSCYIPFTLYKDGKFVPLANCAIEWIVPNLSQYKFVGHNFTYDKNFIKKVLNVDTQWVADTRLMWHMSSAPAGPRPYGLKDAQVEVLGWPDRKDTGLVNHLKEKGIKLAKGESWGQYYYQADLNILAEYACYDTLSTFQLYEKLSPFFDHYDYWDHLATRMAYNELLEINTALGIAVDRQGLAAALQRLIKQRDAAKKRVDKILAGPIAEMERFWADIHASRLKLEKNRVKYLSSPEKWQRFNWNSDPNKRELFYKQLGNPVTYLTDGGTTGNKQPSTKADVVATFKGDWVEPYLTYENTNTLITSFVQSYLDCSEEDGRLHPGFNICGTVSYRLSGFKPYMLNPPFSERRVMKHLKCDPGMIGVHADLAAIEPSLTAHYSSDPSLLRVFRDGLGDVYLDLALELFPNNKELKVGYNPLVKITSEVKKKFEKERSIAKVIQLAVQYTGQKYTVSKNLSLKGFPTTPDEADEYVKAYWKKYNKVKEWEYCLRQLYRRDKHLRNATGNIIRVPDPDYKDLSNRFIQSSGHNILELWVLEIYRLHEEKGLIIKPIILDTHDATSNQVPAAQAEISTAIYQEALDNVNKQLELSVTIKCEIKTFHTLAGLKGDD